MKILELILRWNKISNIIAKNTKAIVLADPLQGQSKLSQLEELVLSNKNLMNELNSLENSLIKSGFIKEEDLENLYL